MLCVIRPHSQLISYFLVSQVKDSYDGCTDSQSILCLLQMLKSLNILS